MLKKWIVRLSILASLFLLGYINIHRLNNNIYSNYERAVEYGRVSENKEIIEPIITAVFYKSPAIKKKNVSTYLDHSDNYKEQNVKIVAAPKILNENSMPVVERLYAEISKHNTIKKAVLLIEDNIGAEKHKKILQKNLNIDDVETLILNENDISAEKNAEDYLQQDNILTVALVDLNNFSNFKNNFLADEVIWLAQKYAYKIHVFDAIDTQIAKAADRDYETLFSISVSKEVPLLKQQQRNLQKYVNQYKSLLLKYFKQNLLLGKEKETIWPAKTVQTYRLYDRGFVYIRFFGENKKELFARAKIGNNKGIIVALVELARKAARKISQPIKSYKIYLLTDFEAISDDKSLINDLETDDGIYISYKDRKALLVADERPERTQDGLEFLYARAKVPQNANKADIKLFKFKTVEIENEN